MTNFDLDHIVDINNMVKDIRNRAIEIACVLDNYKKENVEEVTLCEDTVEVEFSIGPCGFEETHYSVLTYKDLIQDVGELAKQIEFESEQKEKHLRKRLILEIKRGKKIAEKRDRETYLRLKKRFENK